MSFVMTGADSELWKTAQPWQESNADAWRRSHISAADAQEVSDRARERWIARSRNIYRSLGRIHAAIERSRWILDIREGAEGEAMGGAALPTWERAGQYLVTLAIAARRVFGLDLPAPDISAADGGSIDLLWDEGGRTLLVNLPADAAQAGTYYGENASGETISGTTALAGARVDLAAWILRA